MKVTFERTHLFGLCLGLRLRLVQLPVLLLCDLMDEVCDLLMDEAFL